MTLSWKQAQLTNWSKSVISPCFVYPAGSVAEVARAMAAARKEHLPVIPHGAGHSYTDAALNTAGVVIDLTPMRRILSWDSEHGIMRVESGVTIADVIRAAGKDGWWPSVAPSTPEVTVGGCTAMNVNGKNAWKCGPFGTAILALDVLFPSGEERTVTSLQDPQLFYALVGSMGLLGIVTSITLQLQRIPSPWVTLRNRPAASFADLFALFAEEEPGSDFMEAWIDGFAGGLKLGRGILTSAALSDPDGRENPSLTPPPGRLETALINQAAGAFRPALLPGIQMANRAKNWWGSRERSTHGQRALIPYTFWRPAAFAGYHALFPQGVETFQAFVPGQAAGETFAQVLRYSQEQGCLPVWCVIKQHRRDAFLLSYQLDGFSLELNFPRTRQTAQALQPVLEHMIQAVIEAGGRFYLAKDHFLTRDQYRQSMGAEVVDDFLRLKERCDPETALQSDLFRRIFQGSR